MIIRCVQLTPEIILGRKLKLLLIFYNDDHSTKKTQWFWRFFFTNLNFSNFFETKFSKTFSVDATGHYNYYSICFLDKNSFHFRGTQSLEKLNFRIGLRNYAVMLPKFSEKNIFRFFDFSVPREHTSSNVCWKATISHRARIFANISFSTK